MKKIIAIIAALGLIASVQAQDTNAPALPVEPPPIIVQAATNIGKWIIANGRQFGGVGGTFKDIGAGRFNAVSGAYFNLCPTNWFAEIGAAASVLSADETHVGLGVAGTIPLLKIPALEGKTLTPLVPVDGFENWRLGAFVTVDADRAIKLEFDRAHAVAGVFACKRF